MGLTSATAPQQLVEQNSGTIFFRLAIACCLTCVHRNCLQARTGTTISYLHELTGAKLVTQRDSSGGGGNRGKEGTPKGSFTTVVASDTLQLLLDVVLTLQRRTVEAQGTPREGGKAVPWKGSLAGTSICRSSGDGCSTGRSVASAKEGTIGEIVQGWGTQRQQAEGSNLDEAAGVVFLAEVQCWQALTALVEFSTKNPTAKPIGELQP